MLVPGLVDAHTRIGRAPDPAAAARDLIRSGVVAVADVLDDHDAIGVLARSGLGGAAYLEVRCPDERTWEDSERDRLITAIRELDHTGVIGIAAHTPDLAVLEDLAILARTFGLRLHAEPSPATAWPCWTRPACSAPTPTSSTPPRPSTPPTASCCACAAPPWPSPPPPRPPRT
ncbi:amidohydrolase family protein [Thermocatellispora tengchongensis]|uniref:hypothetical protein n=1 Tax=Thermocatellispora tengchongensis TaxID=1073253 RepID=UPI003629AC14